MWSYLTGKQQLPLLSPYGDGSITDSYVSTRHDWNTLRHDWMFASWVIQCLIMDSMSKNPFLIALLEGCGHAGLMAFLATPTCSWRVSSHCGLNTIRRRQKGILKYLEAGVQLFGLGMHLWICIMVSLKFPPGMLAKEGPQIRKSSSGTH